MKRLMPIGLLCGAALLGMTGCSELLGMVAPETTAKGREEAGMKRVEEAKAARDIAALDAIAAEKKSSNVSSAARRAKQSIMLAKLIEGDCAYTEKHFTEDFKLGEGDDIKARKKEVANKLATCGAWDTLFDNARQFGHDALGEVEKDGVKLGDKLLDYLDTPERFKGSMGLDSAVTVSKWLVATKAEKKSKCAVLDKRLGNVVEASRGEFLWFYYEAECGAEALPRAEARLANDEPNLRIQACDILGKFGDSKHIDKLEALAETDPHVVVRERDGYAFKEYDVRDRCKAAVGKIKLRK